MTSNFGKSLRAVRDVFLASVFMSGCAVHSVPDEQLAASEAAVAAAIRAGAPQFASRELNSAQEKLALTRRWIAAGDYKPARWLSEQAQVDAELAAMRARSAFAQGH